MLATSSPDRIDSAFDDDRLVDHAGLLLPATEVYPKVVDEPRERRRTLPESSSRWPEEAGREEYAGC